MYVSENIITTLITKRKRKSRGMNNPLSIVKQTNENIILV